MPDRRSTRRAPRNWLARAEHRRLFWMVMPPAIAIFLLAGWVERALWGPSVSPAPEQIDTKLAGPVRRTISDAVTIEADAGGGVSEDEGDGDLAAARSFLAAVRDDTVFRQADQEAWFGIWQRLRSEAAEGVTPRGRDVTFAQLFSQPRSFRGRRVRMVGTIRRLQEVAAPANALGIERYWQAWLDPVGGPASPVVVYFLSLPPDTPTGMRVDIPAIVDGVFFKRWAYEASDGIRLAPLLMGVEPRRPPQIESGRGTSAAGGWALGSIGLLVASTYLALRYAAATRPSADPLPERIDADFSSVTSADPRESLRRLEAAEIPPGSPP